MVVTYSSLLNDYCRESPRWGLVCPMVDSNELNEVNSSYSFSSGPKKPRCSVLLLTIHRALTFICSNYAKRNVKTATFPIQKIHGIFLIGTHI